MRRRRGASPVETAAAALALAAALYASYRSGSYLQAISERLPFAGKDLLLNALPLWDLTGVYVWGFAAFLGYVFWAGFRRERRRAAYILWMYALLVGIRAFFMILTPLNTPPDAIHADGDVLFDAVGRYLTFRNDLFFSAHTSMPFLGFLIYRDPQDRAVLLFFSILLANTVLLCRLHYSIDVAAAYFITYAVVRAHRRWVEPAWGRWRGRLFGGV